MIGNNTNNIYIKICSKIDYILYDLHPFILCYYRIVINLIIQKDDLYDIVYIVILLEKHLKNIYLIFQVC